jgi:uridine kinase
VAEYNFDHPNAMDWELMRDTFQKLCRHEDVIIPAYNYKTCKRDPPGIELKCTDLILFEGIFALFDPQIREIMDLKIFVHSDDDIRLLRRLKRDVLHRGRSVEGVIQSYNRFVKQAYDEYIKPVIALFYILVDYEIFGYYSAERA